jgi:hypothetical protein
LDFNSIHTNLHNIIVYSNFKGRISNIVNVSISTSGTLTVYFVRHCNRIIRCNGSQQRRHIFILKHIINMNRCFYLNGYSTNNVDQLLFNNKTRVLFSKSSTYQRRFF